jgi:hypothetical protein
MKRLAGGEGLEEDDVRSGSRRRGVVKARRFFCKLAVRRIFWGGGGPVFGGNDFGGESPGAFRGTRGFGEIPEVVSVLRLPTSYLTTIDGKWARV